jgi:hypothetical protein
VPLLRRTDCGLAMGDTLQAIKRPREKTVFLHSQIAPILAALGERVLLSLAMLIASLSICFGQNVDLKNLDVRPMITDLNAIAPRLEKDRLLNSDVSFIAAVGCSNARVALRNRYASIIGPLLRSNYPAPEVINKITIGDYARSEDILLGRLGATMPARIFVQRTIKASATLSVTPPAEDGSLIKALQQLEGQSCQLRERKAEAPSEPAPEPESKIALCIAKGIAGMAVIVGDAVGATMLIEMPIAAGILATISGGWGWTRVEEACF